MRCFSAIGISRAVRFGPYMWYAHLMASLHKNQPKSTPPDLGRLVAGCTECENPADARCGRVEPQISSRSDWLCTRTLATTSPSRSQADETLTQTAQARRWGNAGCMYNAERRHRAHTHWLIDLRCSRVRQERLCEVACLTQDRGMMSLLFEVLPVLLTYIRILPRSPGARTVLQCCNLSCVHPQTGHCCISSSLGDYLPSKD